MLINKCPGQYLSDHFGQQINAELTNVHCIFIPDETIEPIFNNSIQTRENKNRCH